MKEKKTMGTGKILLIVFGSFMALILILTAGLVYELNHPEKPIKNIDDKLIENIYERCELTIPASANLIWGERYRRMDGATIYLFFTLPQTDFEVMMDSLNEQWVSDDIEYYSSQPPEPGHWKFNFVIMRKGYPAYLKYSDSIDGEVAIYFCVK